MNVITFKKFLEGYKKKFVSLELSEDTRTKLRQWCQDNNFDITKSFSGDDIKPEEFDFHVTVFFTDNEVYTEVGLFDIDPIKIRIKTLALLGRKKDVPTFLIKRDPSIRRIRKIYESLGMKDSWPYYKPHVSLSYNYSGTPDIKDIDLPEFDLYADKIKVDNQKEE